jgi:protein-S-isoprenylcysteine O-methyltransferase
MDEYKVVGSFMMIGVIMMIIGHIFRVSAMFTAGKNFTHIISTNKKEQHVLVKTGIYR